MSESILIAIDPGTKKSAVIEYAPRNQTQPVQSAFIAPNPEVLAYLDSYRNIPAPPRVVCEWITSYGMPVGADTFDTVRWIGRFEETWSRVGGAFGLLPRHAVKMAICHSARAKDANIRQALLDRFPPTGGGKTPQVGTKAKPGPLYGVSSHLWAALAVAVSSQDAGDDINWTVREMYPFDDNTRRLAALRESAAWREAEASAALAQ